MGDELSCLPVGGLQPLAQAVPVLTMLLHGGDRDMMP